MKKKNMLKGRYKKSMSSRKVFVRDLPLDQSVTVIKQGKTTLFNLIIGRSRIETLRDDRPLLNNGNGAFTLIELLVVVLIIGILAAVAVPQYQRAVTKSRLMAAVTYLKAVKDAEEIYYLANGVYTDDIDSLSVEGECPNKWVCSIVSLNNIQAHPAGDMSLRVVAPFDHTWLKGQIYCMADPANSQAVSLCKSMGPDIGSDSTTVRRSISN